MLKLNVVFFSGMALGEAIIPSPTLTKRFYLVFPVDGISGTAEISHYIRQGNAPIEVFLRYPLNRIFEEQFIVCMNLHMKLTIIIQNFISLFETQNYF